MTSETGGRRARRTTNELLDTAEELAVGVGRLGYGLLSFGLDLLPRQSRQHMHNAIHELSHAFATLPRDFADIAGAEIERWAVDGGSAAEAPPAGDARVQHIKVSDETTTLGGAASSTATTEAGFATTAGFTAATAASASGVSISFIEFNPAGRDVDGEYVLVRNDGLTTAELTGWTLRDGGARHSFVFPSFTLAPGAEVRIWTRFGANDGANLYWGNRGAIWNNEGDSATLSDAAGVVVGRYSYSG